MRNCTFVLSLTLLALWGSPDDTSVAARTRATSQPLAAAIATIAANTDEVGWVTWTVPAASTARLSCCPRSRWVGAKLSSVRTDGTDAAGACMVEDRDFFGMSHDSPPAARIAVLVRLESRRISRVRVERDDCRLDFGGRKVVSLSDVAPAESVAWLEARVRTREGHSHGDSALPALALHADPTADLALERFVRGDQPLEHRRDAAFWLASARGRRGYETVRSLLKDEDPSFREHLTFALHVSSEPDASRDLIGLARHDRASGVRRQALFWLAQRAGEAAVSTLTAAIDGDPDADVRQHAVFAVSQLPRDRSIPLLIDLSRTHRNPEVRRQAFFWLGQSNDPRALAFFEEVLTR